MTPFQEKLSMLDAALTRKDSTTVSHTAISQNHTPESILFGNGDHCYYLSDCRYSRIYFYIDMYDKVECFLASGSPDITKDMWKNCKELIADVLTEAQQYIDTVKEK